MVTRRVETGHRSQSETREKTLVVIRYRDRDNGIAKQDYYLSNADVTTTHEEFGRVSKAAHRAAHRVAHPRSLQMRFIQLREIKAAECLGHFLPRYEMAGHPSDPTSCESVPVPEPVLDRAQRRLPPELRN